MKWMSVFFLFLFFSKFSVAAGLSKDSSGKDPKEPVTPVDKALLLQLVNDARKKGCKCGDTYYYAAPPLTWNDQLAEAASAHSNDMHKKKYFSHVSPNGDKAGERIEKAGYHWLQYGENIAMGQKNEKELVEGWLKSPGHCKNIMNKLYKEMGVARAGTYWTQTFGTK